MGFQKPLKAFVSYSHKDASLCRSFLAQIKPLVDDGIIHKVWHDGKIGAGSRWDEVIRQELHDSQLFIALTSADYNASGYIESVEMKHAEARHREGTCRMIPVMLRRWVPPQWLRQYQFLPDLNQAVASARNRDDVWALIIERIERAIDEMVAGKWPERTRPVLPDVASLNLCRHLPYLCDWSEPIRRVETSFRPERGLQRRPCVLILIATPEDCHDRFIDRIATRHLVKALGLDIQLEPHIKDFDWVPGFHYEIHDKLGAQNDWRLEKKLPEGLTVLRTTEIGDNWDSAKERLLTEFIRYWHEWKALPGLRGLVSILSIILSRRDSKFVEKIESLVRQESDVRTPILVLEIPRVSSNHAVNWPDHPDVRKCYGSRLLPQAKEILELYPRIDEPLPMCVLAPKLLDLMHRIS